MKKRFVVFLMAILMLPALVANAEDDAAVAPEMDAETKAMMEKWALYSEPADEHARLATDVGKWVTTAKFWMGGPGSEPMVEKGMAERTMILGGRWLEERYSSQFMGQPYEGYGLTGYDKFEKKFVATWMDNMSTMLMTSKGTCNEDGTYCTFHALMDEPVMDVHDKVVRSTSEVVDEDTRRFRSYDALPGGEEFLAMEIVYKRVK